MKVLVCGSRHFKDYNLLKEVLDQYEITRIIHGAARGADSLAAEYAEERRIPVQVFPADWDTYGKAAGPIRNNQMLKEGEPDLTVAFIAPDSRGTRHMVDISKKAGVEVKEVQI